MPYRVCAWSAGVRTPAPHPQAYALVMRDNEAVLDLRRTRLMAVAASLGDARRNLLRAARIPSSFSAELRALLLLVADLDRRMAVEIGG
jgi:hypothetical protein